LLILTVPVDISIDKFLTFPQIQKMGVDINELCTILRYSYLIELSPDGLKARRRVPMVMVDKSLSERSSLYIVRTLHALALWQTLTRPLLCRKPCRQTTLL